MKVDAGMAQQPPLHGWCAVGRQIVEDHVDKDLMFLGTEFGLFVTVDGGKDWAQLKGGNVPTIAFRDFEAVRTNFVRVLDALLDARCYVGIATHDAWLLEQGRRAVAERGLGPDEYEFQMLLGVRPELGDELVREGHRLRIYIPFGTQWYQYSLRRLQENPKIAGYVAADSVGRLLHPRRNGR